MEGFYYYWLFWIFWVIAFFFMKKHKTRTKITAWILIAIILSLQKITLFQIEFSLTSLFLLLTIYFMLGKEKGRRRIYLFITSFIMMLSYTTFLLYELFDPVWVVFNRNFMLVALLLILIITLQKSFKERIISVIAGLVHGDVLYAVILRNISFQYSVGALHFLDTIAFTTFALLGISWFKKLSAYFESHIKQLEREKQKQS